MLGFGGNGSTTAKSESKNLLWQVETEDLLKFGMIPEFIGRIPIVAPLNELDKEAMIEILTKPKNALVKQYAQLLSMEGVDLTFTEEALDAIADKALARKTGARGLRAIIENCMLDVMYDIPSNPAVKEIIITPETVNDNKPPVMVLHNEALAS